MTIEDRVQSLEAELMRIKRRTQKVAFVAGLLACAMCWSISEQRALAPPANGIPTEIVANRFVVADEKGGRRVLIGELANDTYGLRCMEENGAIRLALSAIPGAAMFAAFDKNGVVRTGLNVDESGSFFTMKDKDGKQRLTLSSFDGAPSIALKDDSGVTLADLTIVPKHGPSLAFKDKKGVMRQCLLLDDKGPQFMLFDERQTLRTVIGAMSTISKDGKKTTYPESSLLLFGPDEKVLRALP